MIAPAPKKMKIIPIASKNGTLFVLPVTGGVGGGVV